jgi:hypothetical protein
MATVAEFIEMLQKFYHPNQVIAFDYTDKETAEIYLSEYGELTDEEWNDIVKKYEDTIDESGNIIDKLIPLVKGASRF